MTNIIRLEPHSLAVFFSADADPGFIVKLCNDASLFDTVHCGMFMPGTPQDADTREEVAGIVDKLREGGDIAFEQGWVSLRIGLADATAFLMEKLGEAKQEERYADKQRYEELKRREAAEDKYEILRGALVLALGDKVAMLAVGSAA